MKNKFKIGDEVILTIPNGIHELEINKIYVISDIKNEMKNEMIALDGTGVMTNHNYPYPNYLEFTYYNAKRFKKSLKIIRKKKLSKIYVEKVDDITFLDFLKNKK